MPTISALYLSMVQNMPQPASDCLAKSADGKPISATPPTLSKVFLI
ncbi:hypothetical protein [Microcoleus anatoxicus]|uniref:Uncharacterized protein n=1 Tax=Microcoleus anatoxicus PTRS2 TaxID=2705321 RepID=A0ABU8YYK2_9CYAN